jgi:predicted MFS family arabinose efflux permease
MLFINSKKLTERRLPQESSQKSSRFMLCKASKSFWAVLMIGILDSSTRMGFLTFFPFVLQEKGAGVSTIGLALSLIFAGGAMGKLACGVLATKVGVLRSVIITEILTALCIIGILNFSLHMDIILALLLGVALNGTSSVLYGSVPDLVPADNTKQAFAVFYTATIASGAFSPWFYGIASDVIGIKTVVSLVALVVLFTIPLTMPLRGKLKY